MGVGALWREQDHGGIHSGSDGGGKLRADLAKAISKLIEDGRIVPPSPPSADDRMADLLQRCLERKKGAFLFQSLFRWRE
jgi:hypothetical protein